MDLRDKLEKEELVRVLESSSEELLENEHSIDIAAILEDFKEDELDQIINKLSDEDLALVFEQCSLELQITLVDHIDSNRMLRIFSFMSKDDIVDVLGELKVNKQKELINLMKLSDQKIINTLLSYKEDSAGGIMTTEYVCFSTYHTVGECLDKLRLIAPKSEVIDPIFITTQNKELIGVVSIRDLISSSKDVRMEEIMDDNIIYCYPDDDQEYVSNLVSKYDLHAIAVVNRKKQLIGIITVDDIIDVIVEEHHEDVAKFAGASALEEPDTPLIKSIKFRLPWLLVNLITSFLSSSTIAAFSPIIEKAVILASISPIIASTGGNAGTQELAITIRSISLGETKFKDALPLLTKAIGLGLINGLILGSISGFIMSTIYHNIYLWLIILLSMTMNLILACVFGFIIPRILKALKIDPAMASGVFLTTVTDIGGFMLFLGLSSLFIDKLF